MAQGVLGFQYEDGLVDTARHNSAGASLSDFADGTSVLIFVRIIFKRGYRYVLKKASPHPLQHILIVWMVSGYFRCISTSGTRQNQTKKTKYLSMKKMAAGKARLPAPPNRLACLELFLRV